VSTGIEHLANGVEQSNPGIGVLKFGREFEQGIARLCTSAEIVPNAYQWPPIVGEPITYGRRHFWFGIEQFKVGPP
jgi:hypothetical protein